MNAISLQRPLRLTAWIAGVFCLLVCGVLIREHYTAATNDPWKSPQLLALKDKLSAEPKNEAVQNEIRQLDQQFRQRFRHRLMLDKSGGWLLLGGMAVLVLAAGKAAALKTAPAMPQTKTDAAEQILRAAARARVALAGVGLAVAGALLLIRLANPSALPSANSSAQAAAGNSATGETAAEAAIPLAAFQTNWPRFRGWDGSGATTQTNTGTNVAWRSAVPAPGHSSPIVWGDRVFISGGTAAKREVFCYDAGNGALLWQRAVENVPGSPAKVPEVPEDTTYAASTMATDGHRVFAIFATGDLAAMNFDGSVAWTKYVGPMKNSYGYATSLAIWGTNLLVQLDQGESPGEGSKLLALQSATGRVLWERSRPVSASWATPIVFEAAGKTQILTLGKPLVMAYALDGGNELWRSDLLVNEVVPSPVFTSGLIFLLSPSDTLFALRPDGAGDVARTTIVWTNDENIPDIVSPAAHEGLVYTMSSMGMIKCFEAGSGKKNWETNLDTEVQASPGITGDRLIILTQNGSMVTLRAGRELREIGRCRWADKFQASPAFAGGRTFLRGVTNLFCLEPGAVPPAKQP